MFLMYNKVSVINAFIQTQLFYYDSKAKLFHYDSNAKPFHYGSKAKPFHYDSKDNYSLVIRLQ